MDNESMDMEREERWATNRSAGTFIGKYRLYPVLQGKILVTSHRGLALADL
jgi:hypothetical protein